MSILYKGNSLFARFKNGKEAIRVYKNLKIVWEKFIFKLYKGNTVDKSKLLPDKETIALNNIGDNQDITIETNLTVNIKVE